MTSTPARANRPDPEAPNAADAALFAMLETAFGSELPAVIARYIKNSDGLCTRLQLAAECAYWQEAVRTALKIGREADALGFRRVAKAARQFADDTYHSDSPHKLRNGAQAVVFEYERFRLALEAHFPGLVEKAADSVA